MSQLLPRAAWPDRHEPSGPAGHRLLRPMHVLRFPPPAVPAVPRSAGPAVLSTFSFIPKAAGSCTAGGDFLSALQEERAFHGGSAIQDGQQEWIDVRPEIAPCRNVAATAVVGCLPCREWDAPLVRDQSFFAMSPSRVSSLVIRRSVPALGRASK